MSESTVYGQMYGRNVMQLAQQKNAKLINTVTLKPNVNGKTFFQDQIGAWSMSLKAGRNSDSPNTDPALGRRMGTMLDYNDGHLLDKEDDLKIISDIKSSYTIAAAQSIGRQIDDTIIDALGGTAKSGETGSTDVVLPSSQKIANSSAGLTLAKVLEAKRILDNNDVEAEDRFFVTSPQGLEDLLAVEQATSSDYNTVRALVRGEIDTWLGFKWIMSTRLDVTSNVRSCFAYQKSGTCLGMASAPVVETDKRADKSFAWYLYYSLHLGAVRLEEDKVVQVDILES